MRKEILETNWNLKVLPMASNRVVDWLKDQTILITGIKNEFNIFMILNLITIFSGATGFVGNNLLLKLIDPKSAAKKIYVLVRNGKNISASKRIFELVNGEGYSTDNIHILAGDITSLNFELDQDTIERVIIQYYFILFNYNLRRL